MLTASNDAAAEPAAPPPVPLSAPLGDLPGLGPVRCKQLERLGLHTVADLLTHYPRRYEDRRQFAAFPAQASDTPTCVCGVIIHTAVKRLGGRRSLLEVTLQEPAGHALSSRLIVRWFNAFYLQKTLAYGQRMVVYGKPKTRGKDLVIDQPEFEVLPERGDAEDGAVEEETLIHLRRITPVYPTTEGLSQRTLRALIYRTLWQVDLGGLETPLPEGLDPFPRGVALQWIHFPADEMERLAGRRHLVLTEFFAMQLIIAARRAKTVAQLGENHAGPGKLLERFLASLPFPPTGAQTRALAEIRGDLAATRPMNRLLQGDVGAGKTLVALGAMLLAVEAGFQAALMAPTQILAEQHYLNFRRWLDPLGIRVALRTGNRREQTESAADEELATEPELPLAGAHLSSGGASFEELQAALASASARLLQIDANFRGVPSVAPPPPPAPAPAPVLTRASRKATPAGAPPPQIYVGTHALLHDKQPIPRLGLAVVDEQHKFGVLQRAALAGSGGQFVPPDVLVMTATPIPRTLAITVYGDLDVSVLDELPAGRVKIVTGVRPASKLPEAAQFLFGQLHAGRQAYVVYPLIEESEKLSAKAATERFEYWSEVLKPYQCGLLHGRIPPDEKEAIMRRFRDGEIHALISTTVIEVGIDVKNATLMLIENAERFGLAQLHQLRGRIGRGEHKSYCILLTGADASPESYGKLRVMEETSDGFKIAEADLRLRGPGDILGTAQSGLPPLKLGDLVNDAELMRTARAAARAIFERDPALETSENQRFARYLVESRKHALAQVS